MTPSKNVNLSLRRAGDGSPLGGQDTTVLTILDNDSAIEFENLTYRVNENGTNAWISLKRTGSTTNAFDVTFATLDNIVQTNQAKAGVDYIATNGILHFSPGQITSTFPVAIKDNILLDGDKVVSLALTNVTGNASLGVQTNANLIIVDDECLLDFALSDVQVEEYAGNAILSVRRTGGTVNTVSVNYTTLPGTATANRDFIPTSGTLTFKGDYSTLAQDGSGVLVSHKGDVSQSVAIQILDNNIGDGNRLFFC